MLCRLVKIDGKWSRPEVMIHPKNGKIIPGIVVIKKQPVEIPLQSDGRKKYLVRYSEGHRLIYQNVGDEDSFALTQLKIIRDRLNLIEQNKLAGIPMAPGFQVAGPSQPTLRAVFNEMINEAESRGATERVGKLNTVRDEFLALFEQAGRLYPEEFLRGDVAGYLNSLRKNGLGDYTVYQRNQDLKALLRFAGINFELHKLFKVPLTYEIKDPTPYSPERRAALIQALKKEKNLKRLAIYAVFLSCGLREQEGMHLEWNTRIHLGKYPYVRVAALKDAKLKIDFKVKDNEARKVPISEWLADLLRKHRRNTLTTAS